MRVPTIDYTPLRQANATKTQTEQSKFIAPQMDNQRKSLQLNKEAISKKVGAVNTNLGFSLFQGAVNLGQLAVKTYDTVKSYQDSLAEREGKQMVGQWQTGVAGLIANGQLNISQSSDGHATFNPEGIQAVDQIQNAQLKHIDNQKWLPSVKADLKQRMQDFYAEREQSMLEAFYVKATEDKQLLDQADMKTAQDKDAAEWHYTDYRHFDAKVNSMEGLTEAGKERIMKKGHEEIDFMRAANEVRDVAINDGQAAAEARANSISDARDYNPDDRKKLLSYAGGSAKEAYTKAYDEGLRFMDSEIQNAINSGTMPDFGSLRKQKMEEISRLPQEQRDAYESGMETSQLKFLNDLYLQKTKGIDNFTIDELRAGLEDANNMDSVFEGSTATRKVQDNLKDEYEKRIKKFDDLTKKLGEEIDKETKENNKAMREHSVAETKILMDDVYNQYTNGEIGSTEAQEVIRSRVEKSLKNLDDKGLLTYKEYDDLNKYQNQLITKLRDEKNIPQHLKKMIDDCVGIVDDAIYDYFNTDPEAWTEEGKKAREIVGNVKAMLMDLVRDSGNLKQEDFEREMDYIKVLFNKKLYNDLSKTKDIGLFGGSAEGNAFELLGTYEKNPELQKLVRYNEDKGRYIWLSSDLKQTYEDAAITARNALENVYGIELDHEKPVEYVKVKNQFFTTQAGETEFAPMFYAKNAGEAGETDKFIIQNGKLYRYDSQTKTASAMIRKR